MKKYIITLSYKLFLALVTVAMLQGCETWLNVRPESEVGEEQMFSSEQGYIDALYGVYVNMGKTDLYGGKLPMMLDVMGKTFNVNESNDMAYFAKYDYKTNQCAPIIDKVWERLYYCIMLSNNIIAHIEKANPKDFLYYDYIKGEALGLRAYLHYEILKLFAPNYNEMPDYISIPYKKLYSNDIEPQRTVKDILNLIMEDLILAKNLLENDVIRTNQPEFVEYIRNSNNNESSDVYKQTFLLDRKFRMNYYGVLATMARIHLDRNEKTEAANCANEIIQCGQYRFIRDIDFIDDKESNYKKDVMFNDEIIFGLFSTHIDGYSNTYYFPSGTVPNRAYIPGDYETEDRFSKIFNKQGDIRIMFYEEMSNHQPKQRLLNRHVSDNNISKQKIRMVTLHEIYLIAAECNPSQSIELLENITSSRKFSSGLNSNSTENDIMKFIAEEYRREYVGEGHFWYLFKRNANKSFLQELETGIGTTTKNLVLPLPEAEIEHGHRVSEIWK